MGTPIRSVRKFLQQVERVATKHPGEPLKRLQREISFASLDSSDVRPVNAPLVRKALLRQPKLQPHNADVRTDAPLKCALDHKEEVR